MYVMITPSQSRRIVGTARIDIRIPEPIAVSKKAMLLLWLGPDLLTQAR